MLRNYLKTALRNLWKNKLNAAINLTGLSIGLACCLLIALYIAGELRFDRHHAQADRIWRVTRSFLGPDGVEDLHLSAVAPPFGPLLKEEFPEIEHITRLLQYNATIRLGEKLYPENNIFLAEANVFDVFSIPLTQGNPRTALDGPLQVLLSEKTARRYFGQDDPMDRELRLNNQYTFRVTGVYPDFPAASHFHPDLLLSFSTLNDSTIYGEENLRTNFGNNSFYTYLLAAPNFEPAKMAARFPAFLDKVIPSKMKASTFTELHLQRLTDIHLRSHLDDEIEAGGDIRRVRMFGVIALVILLIACINYINLSTAFSLSRSREIGVRKAAGARRQQILGQFLSESVLLTLGATVLAVGLTALALPLLKKALGVELLPSLLTVWYVPLALLGSALAVGLLAGLYPALFLSSFQPVQVLKGSMKIGKSGISLRKGLVVAQFFISIVLLVGTAVIYRQLNFMQDRELGLDKERVITFGYNPQVSAKWDAFRNELLANPLVQDVALSSRLPSTRLLDDLGNLRAQLGADSLEPSTVTLKCLFVDYDFVPTYNLQMAAGRNFSREYPTDSTSVFILNEAAVKAVGWKSAEEAVGKLIDYGSRKNAQIIGVLRDFHFESLHQNIQPMIFLVPRRPNFYGQISVKIGGDLPGGLAHLQTTWNKFVPDFPLDYTFLDEQYGRLYVAEQRQGRLFTVFAGLAIFIACLGLFGLVTFAAYQRTKEIGIRKVLGASATNIVGLLSRDFLKLVAVAFLLAVPVAWWAMHQWLRDFAYRTAIDWWIFVLAGLVAVAIALLTVSYQSLKAAFVNPVRSLRSE